MAYEPRTFQAVTANTPPTGTDPLVDNTSLGDVQAIKLLDATPGSTTPLAGQQARAISIPTAWSTEDAALVDGLESALASILAKLIAAPATEAKQDIGNTSLATLITQTDGIEASLTSILAKLLAAPSTEAKQDSIITLLTTQAGYLDGVETLLTAIDGHVDGLESVEGTTAGAAVITDASGTIQQYLRGLVKLWIAGLAAGEAHIGQVGGTTVVATGTMTRPADTTAYAVGDGITTATSSASAMSVTSAARISAGSGVIFGGKMTKSTTGTTNASFRGWIYQDTPTAIPNDNAAFTAAVHADYQKRVCKFTVDFAATGVVGSDGVESVITLDRPNCGYKLASGTAFTVILEARGAYTPGNAEIFRLALDCVPD